MVPVSDALSGVRAASRRLEERIREKLSGEVRRVWVLKVYALGPADMQDLIRWSRGEGPVLEQLMKRLMEIRGEYLRLKVMMREMVDLEATRKLVQLYRLREEVLSGEGEAGSE